MHTRLRVTTAISPVWYSSGMASTDVTVCDAAMAGYSDSMISQWLTEYVIVPLKLVILGRKRIPKEGIFWKSVLAKTGQSSDLKTPPLARVAST